jgi:outer membrane protein OmpA-like peptidoglycan-associated protein
MKTIQLLIILSFVALYAGCTTMAPKELVNARSAYQLASQGPAAQLAPADLHKAQQALDLAEQSFKKDSDSYKTKDLAYVAQRKAELAGAIGAMTADKAIKEKADVYFQKQQGEIVKQGKQDLIDSEKRTADAQTELDKRAAVKEVQDKATADLQQQQTETANKAKQDLIDSEKRTADAQTELDKRAAVKEVQDKAAADLQQQQTETANKAKQDLIDSEKRTADAQTELDKRAADKAIKDKADADLQVQQTEIANKSKQDLIDSEKRTADALAELAALAAVKEEERGLVITLSGGVLFRSGDSNLLSSAEVKLDQVATALLAVKARNIIIEGYTDSQGSESYNQGLSQRRADTVRDYLVQKGYPADRIQSRGKGMGSPIADNSSPEGRANNRRVEIVIERTQLSNL